MKRNLTNYAVHLGLYLQILRSVKYYVTFTLRFIHLTLIVRYS